MRCTACETPPVVAAPPLAPQDDCSGRDLKILVAEDSPIIRTLISKQLVRLGFEAHLVCNGAEAVEAVQSDHYDVILMDMQMPVMDGISATREIRSLPRPVRDIPVIALTPNALIGERESCLAAGRNAFLTKPIQPNALRAAILDWGSGRAVAASHGRVHVARA